MEVVKESKKKPTSPSTLTSLGSIFMHADSTDMWLMAFGFTGAVVDGLGIPLMLIVTSKIMNNLGGAATSDNTSLFTQNLKKNSINLLYLACASWVSSFLEGYCWTRTGERQASRMRARYLKAVIRQDISYFDMRVTSTNEVIDGVSTDSLAVQDVLTEKVPHFVMNASTFFGAHAVAFFLSWRLALVALPFLVVLIIPGLMYGRILMGLARRIREEYGKAGVVAERAVSSIRTVYAFVGEGGTMREFSRALEGSVKLGLKQGLVKGVAIGSNGITFAIWSFMCWYGSRLVMNHGGDGGTVFAVGASIIGGGLALGAGLSNVKYFSEAAAAAERVMEVIERVPNIDSDDMGGEVLGEVSGEVEFRSVGFAYPSRPDALVFGDFNFKVPAGRTVALVGGSGSGKSTAIALLERFYDPLKGEILLDGVDIKRLQLKWLRSQIGLVSQEPALFATTIKNNIMFGREDATMDEVVAAAKAANIHAFVSQLPEAYDTEVGECGVKMSGGQKQRIAIARAVVKRPKLLLLDEATSALDAESERVVQDALDAASVGRTTIVVAHRLSTVRGADAIAVLQSGRVAECGTHDELVRGDRDGVYAALVRLQRVDEVPSLATTAASHDSSENSSFRSSACNDECEASPEELAVPKFRRLLMMNRPEWREGAIGCACALVFGAIQPLYAYALGGMIAVYFIEDHEEMKRKTRTYCLVFVGLALLSMGVNVGQHYSFAAMGERLTRRVRERMLSNILMFEVGWFDQDDNSTGAVCSRLVKDANVVRSLVGDRMALVVQTLSAVVIACAMGLALAWRLAVVMVAVQPLIILCFYSRRVLLKAMSAKAMKSQSESSKIAAEAVSNLRTVTAFSAQDRILRLFDEAQQAPKRESARQSWFAGLGLGTTQSLMSCSWALDFWYGGRLVSQGHITAKALFQTFMILVSTGRVIADAGSMTSDLAKGADAVASVFAVLDRVTRVDPDDPDGLRVDRLDGRVEFRDVHFAYPARPDVAILRGLNLSAEAGKSTALVGRSGSGKSTVIALIERFYDPVKGVVRIDGRDVRSYHLRTLRRRIALVGQEPPLFAGTVRENIAYGCGGEASEAEVMEAARAANAHEFVACLREGYETRCGERGAQLSGGQKQRIAIARAILKDPAILLLDEATSALDGQSERLVQEALERVMVGRTSVVVAHRLNTIQNCDAIAVLDKGRVVEKGTHASLLAKGQSRVYFSLVRLQQSDH
ncbi:putative multidrug resistance protein [Acorus gramineus]|uniref:Multidrug resistance protein n=1 Tax=Acorus gramineus TaxID=55184 RepID=A0AAV9BA16_ACOGR|nr:putative multidrug resistance protein [Acorus gramineus]